MTARDFSDLFKGVVILRRVVEAAGISESAWYAAVNRERELTLDEHTRLREALKEHAREIATMAKDVKP
ncbi:MAG: hypothetical protein AAFU51_10315 [Bacteroidota bacterium]